MEFLKVAVLDPLLLILYNADMLNDLENKIILYADDTTLYADVASPSDCIIPETET